MLGWMRPVRQCGAACLLLAVVRCLLRTTGVNYSLLTSGLGRSQVEKAFSGETNTGLSSQRRWLVKQCLQPDTRHDKRRFRRRDRTHATSLHKKSRKSTCSSWLAWSWCFQLIGLKWEIECVGALTLAVLTLGPIIQLYFQLVAHWWVPISISFRDFPLFFLCFFIIRRRLGAPRNQ